VPDVTKQPSTELVSTAATSQSFAAPSTAKNGASHASAALSTTSNGPRPTPPWQTSLEPAIVAAIRVVSLAEYQVQMERFSCEREQCMGSFRVPPSLEASRKLSSAAQIFDNLKNQLAQEDIDVSMSSIRPGPEGLAVSFQFTPTTEIQGRTYTPGEIAAIRLESFEQGRKSAQSKSNTLTP